MDRIKIVSAEERELAELIVSTLNLELSAAEVDPDAALYREGLGLDSIDILEIALAVSKTYGFQLRSDDSDNIKIFSFLCPSDTNSGRVNINSYHGSVGPTTQQVGQTSPGAAVPSAASLTVICFLHPSQ